MEGSALCSTAPNIAKNLSSQLVIPSRKRSNTPRSKPLDSPRHPGDTDMEPVFFKSEEELALNEQSAKLRREKDELIVKKRDLETTLASVTGEFRYFQGRRVPDHKYADIVSRQTRLKNNIRDIEAKCAEVSGGLRDVAEKQFRASASRKRAIHASAEENPRQGAVIVSVPTATDFKRECVEKIVSLSAYYQEFAADATRISSKRQMAAEFANKLNPIIKRFLKD